MRLHVRFDERGVETGATGELVRHRQTKGAATDMFGLKPPAPHSDSTNLIQTTPSAVGPLFINFLKNLCTDITAAFAGADWGASANCKNLL